MGIVKYEFRLGNYVQDVVSGEWMIIDELGENIGATIINRDKYPLPDGWQMGPIPITPEILERAGFEKGCLYSKEYGYTAPKEAFFFENDYYPNEMSSGRSIGKEIEYLHQLQNIYFALTGEELNINL